MFIFPLKNLARKGLTYCFSVKSQRSYSEEYNPFTTTDNNTNAYPADYQDGSDRMSRSMYEPSQTVFEEMPANRQAITNGSATLPYRHVHAASHVTMGTRSLALEQRRRSAPNDADIVKTGTATMPRSQAERKRGRNERPLYTGTPPATPPSERRSIRPITPPPLEETEKVVTPVNETKVPKIVNTRWVFLYYIFFRFVYDEWLH